MVPRRMQTLSMIKIACCLLGCSLWGCSEQGKRLNAPPQGESARPHELKEQFVYMVDKGMLYDSSIADIHFEPHSSELSGTGIRRLMRLGELMTEVGGTIHYETDTMDEQLVNNRLEVVREFLLAGGFDMQRIEVKTGLARGRGMTSHQAMLSAQKAAAGGGASAGQQAP